MKKFSKKMAKTVGGSGGVVMMRSDDERMDEIKKPINEQFRQEFQNQADKIDREYQREKERQEHVGETLSRIVPTSSLTYIAMELDTNG